MRTDGAVLYFSAIRLAMMARRECSVCQSSHPPPPPQKISARPQLSEQSKRSCEKFQYSRRF